MGDRQTFARGLVAGVLLMLGAHAANWFIGGHPEAGSLRVFLAAVQLVGGLGGAAWLIFRRPPGAVQST